MENSLLELSHQPKPLVFVIGTVEDEPDASDLLIRALKEVSIEAEQKELPTFDFKSIPLNNSFLSKKNSNDFAADTSGILKSQWILKHLKSLPSVLIMLTTFSVDWSAGEWIRRESLAQEFLSKLRQSVSGRDVKVLVVAIKTGSGLIEKEVLEERTNSMRRHLNLEGRSLTLLTINEITSSIGSGQTSTSIKKLNNTIRENSNTYYATQGKKYKNVKKVSTKLAEVILLARYNFKIAFFYEFQSQWPRALRHYRQCHLTLIDLIKIADEELIYQILTLSELSNYKICYLLYRTGGVKEAVLQIRSHIQSISNNILSSKDRNQIRLWRLYGWMARQFLSFISLLSAFNISQSLLPDCDRSYYYHNAAKYTVLRHESLSSRPSPSQLLANSTDTPSDTTDGSSTPLLLPADVNRILTLYPGMILAPPRYLGGSYVLMDPVLDQEHVGSSEWKGILLQLEDEQESRTDTSGLAVAYINSALEHIAPRYKRRRALLRRLLAELQMLREDYESALLNLNTSIDYMLRERWFEAALPLLQSKMNCAILAGRMSEFVQAAITAYAFYVNNQGKYHGGLETVVRFVRALHVDVMDLLMSSAPSPTSVSASALSSLNVSKWGEYGKHVTHGTSSGKKNPTVESHLPKRCNFLFSETFPLLRISVRMSQLIARVGQQVAVTLTVTSQFIEDIQFSEMRVHFGKDIIVQPFLHEDNFTVDEPPASASHRHEDQTDHSLRPGAAAAVGFERKRYPARSASLQFSSGIPRSFRFSVTIPELDSTLGLFSLGNDKILFVEKVVFINRVPIEFQETDDSYLTTSTETTYSRSGGKNFDVTFSAPVTNQSEDRTDNSGSSSGNKGASMANIVSGLSLDVSGRGRGDAGDGDLQPISSAITSLINEVSRGGVFDDDETDDGSVSDSGSGKAPRVSVSDKLNDGGSSGFRIITWDVPTIARDVLYIQPLPQTPTQPNAPPSVRESTALHSYIYGRNGPPIIHIHTPKCSLELLSPLPRDDSGAVLVLQGPIQRIDVVLKLGEGDRFFDSRAHVSVDPPPANANSAFFWYPDLADVIASGKLINSAQLQDSNFLDSVTFHPIKLHPNTFQPAFPFKLPSSQDLSDGILVIPLFIRSEVVDTFKIKLKVEYKGHKAQKQFASKEFSVDVEIVKPFAINFNLTSVRDAPCGCGDTPLAPSQSLSPSTAGGGGGMFGSLDGSEKSFPMMQSTINIGINDTFAIRGDVLRMYTSVACLNSLGEEINLTALRICPPPVDKTTAEAGRIFEIQGADGPSGSEAEKETDVLRSMFSMLTNRTAPVDSGTIQQHAIPLKRGELFVGYCSIRCLDVPSSMSEPPPVRASIGSTEVRWHPRNQELLCPNRAVARLLTPSGSSGEVGSDKLEKPLSWLLPLDTSTSSALQTIGLQGSSSESVQGYIEPLVSDTGLERSLACTRECQMTFTVPSIQVMSAPFDVAVSAPPSARRGTPVAITLVIRNRLSTLEALNIQVEVRDHVFVLCGSLKSTLEVAPSSDVTASLLLIPLVTGQITLPKIKILWSKRNTVVLEVGGSGMASCIFVYPNNEISI